MNTVNCEVFINSNNATEKYLNYKKMCFDS